MKHYKIKYLPASQADLLGIFEYISPLNRSAAKRLLNVFDNEIIKTHEYASIGQGNLRL